MTLLSQAEAQDRERMAMRQARREPVLCPCDNAPACTAQVWGKWTVCSACLRARAEKEQNRA